jgi:hypothetical protein
LQLETIVPLLHSKKLSLLKNYECTLSSPSLIKSIDEGQKVRALLKCYCLAQLAWHMFDYLFQFDCETLQTCTSEYATEVNVIEDLNNNIIKKNKRLMYFSQYFIRPYSLW